MIEEAIARGFDSLGFSIHSHVPYSSLRITPDRIEAYNKKINELKPIYADRIKIFRGIEHDFYSDSSPNGYDYNLLAVHYLMANGNCRGFDVSLEGTVKYVNENFGGDGLAFAKRYYETLADAPSIGKFDIIAHIDIVAKNNEKGGFFDTSSKEYLSYAYDAIDALKGKIPFFEVNTGGVARGYRSSFYPQRELLIRLRECGFGATISSDCHNKAFVDYGFDEAAEYLRSAGFNSKFVLTENGFEEVAL
jgi:histidinol-phosphatase (PHP family)